jgi:hypothetical protein
MPFRRIIHGKSKLSANNTAERHAFPHDKPRKVKTFREFSCGKFQYTVESQYLTFLMPISTIGDQYYPGFGKKMEKHGITENNHLTFRR